MNFCPVCGKSTEETFCKEHTPISFDYKDIVARVCKCRKHFYRNRWLPFQSLKDVVKKVAIENIKQKVIIKPLVDEEVEKKNFEIEVSYQGKTFIIPAKIQVEKCPSCSKQGTGYFVSTLQLRPRDPELLEFAINLIEKADGEFIESMVERKEGYDLLLSSNKIALLVGKKLSKSYKGELKTSRNLHTFDHQRSKHVYRSTVCFRKE